MPDEPTVLVIEDDKQIRRFLRALLSSQGYRVIDADGGVRWISARGRPADGNRERLLGVALDITERKAAELHAAEGRMALRHMTRVSMVGQLSAAIAHERHGYSHEVHFVFMRPLPPGETPV